MVLERRKVLYQIKCISPIQPDTNNVKALKNVKSVNINHLNMEMSKISQRSKMAQVLIFFWSVLNVQITVKIIKINLEISEKF